MPTTTDYLNQLISDKADLAANLTSKGVTASSSETFTELVPKVLDISGGGTDWGDTITDDWDTIIANANTGTVNGYSIGDTKSIEFIYDGTPYVIQCEIIGKSHDTISGSNPATTAALTFMVKWLGISWRMNATATNAGGWMGEDGDLYATSLDESGGALVHGCEMRKKLWEIYKALPTNLQNAIKIVDKIYDDTSSLRTSKEKLFLPSTEEMGAASQTILVGQGTEYAKFTNAISRKKTGIAYPGYYMRSRRTNNQYFQIISSPNGAASGLAATTYAGMCFCFCL